MTQTPYTPPKSNVKSNIGNEEKGKVRVWAAEGKPTILVKKGFSWPAFLFGPFWAIYKSFWPAAIVLVVVHLTLKMLYDEVRSVGYPLLSWSIATVRLVLVILFGAWANKLYAAYLSTKGYKISAGTQDDDAAAK